MSHFLGKHAEARPADDAARRAWRSAPIFTRALCGPQGKLAKRKRRGGRGPLPPGCRCPNMRRGSQPACIFGRLSLLRFGCFCRRQRLSSAAKHASLYRPQDALRCACPLGTKFPGEPRTRLTARTLPPENFPVGVRAVRACRPARTDFEIGSLSRKARGSFLFCAWRRFDCTRSLSYILKPSRREKMYF